MKKILLTGATDGIGFETAKLFAAQGHHLLIHGRNESKLTDTHRLIQNSYPQAKIEHYRADLSDFDEVRAMLAAIKNAHNTIDIIINNAGVFRTVETKNKDQLDIRFVVNTLTPYIITLSLRPILAEDGRVINLSSAAQAPIDLNAMEGMISINDAFEAYAQSKLALTIWSQELAKSLGPKQVMIAVNPGSMLASKMVKEGFGVTGNDLNIGSEILVKTALSDEFSHASGKYFDNDSGQIALPHSDALRQDRCDRVMQSLEKILDTQYGRVEV